MNASQQTNRKKPSIYHLVSEQRQYQIQKYNELKLQVFNQSQHGQHATVKTPSVKMAPRFFNKHIDHQIKSDSGREEGNPLEQITKMTRYMEDFPFNTEIDEKVIIQDQQTSRRDKPPQSQQGPRIRCGKISNLHSPAHGRFNKNGADVRSDPNIPLDQNHISSHLQVQFKYVSSQNSNNRNTSKKQTSNIDSQGYHKKADSWIDEIKDSVMQKHDRYRKKGYQPEYQMHSSGEDRYFSQEMKPSKTKFMSKRIRNKEEFGGQYKNHPFFMDGGKGKANRKNPVNRLNESVFETTLLKNFPNGHLTKEIYRRRNQTHRQGNASNYSTISNDLTSNIKYIDHWNNSKSQPKSDNSYSSPQRNGDNCNDSIVSGNSDLENERRKLKTQGMARTTQAFGLTKRNQIDVFSQRCNQKQVTNTLIPTPNTSPLDSMSLPTTPGQQYEMNANVQGTERILTPDVIQNQSLRASIIHNPNQTQMTQQSIDLKSAEYPVIDQAHGQIMNEMDSLIGKSCESSVMEQTRNQSQCGESQMNFEQAKQLKLLYDTLQDKNLHLEDEIKAILRPKEKLGQSHEQTQVQVYKFFKERDNYIKTFVEKAFLGDQPLIQDLPEDVSELIATIFESQRSSTVALIKFFTNELQSNNFFQKKAKEIEANLRIDLNKYKREHDQFLKFQDEIFKQEKDEKYNEIYKMLKDFDPAKKNPFDMEDREQINDYSGAERLLEAINKNMEIYKGFSANLGRADDEDLSFMNSIPIDDINLLISNNSTALQKRTAYRVMQRYFRNFETAEIGQNVNFDEDLTGQMVKLEIKIQNKDRQIAMQGNQLIDKEKYCQYYQVKMVEMDKKIEQYYISNAKLNQDIETLNKKSKDEKVETEQMSLQYKKLNEEREAANDKLKDIMVKFQEQNCEIEELKVQTKKKIKEQLEQHEELQALQGQKAAVEDVYEQFKDTVEGQLDDFKRLAITIDEGGVDEEEAMDELVDKIKFCKAGEKTSLSLPSEGSQISRRSRRRGRGSSRNVAGGMSDKEMVVSENSEGDQDGMEIEFNLKTYKNENVLPSIMVEGTDTDSKGDDQIMKPTYSNKKNSQSPQKSEAPNKDKVLGQPVVKRKKVCYGEDTGIINDKCTQTKISGAIKALFDDSDRRRPTKVTVVNHNGFLQLGQEVGEDDGVTDIGGFEDGAPGEGGRRKTRKKKKKAAVEEDPYSALQKNHAVQPKRGKIKRGVTTKLGAGFEDPTDHNGLKVGNQQHFSPFGQGGQQMRAALSNQITAMYNQNITNITANIYQRQTASPQKHQNADIQSVQNTHTHMQKKLKSTMDFDDNASATMTPRQGRRDDLPSFNSNMRRDGLESNITRRITEQYDDGGKNQEEELKEPTSPKHSEHLQIRKGRTMLSKKTLSQIQQFQQ